MRKEVCGNYRIGSGARDIGAIREMMARLGSPITRATPWSATKAGKMHLRFQE